MGGIKRIDERSCNSLNTIEIIDAFEENLNSIYKNKKKEFFEDLLNYHEKVDEINSMNLWDGDRICRLMILDSLYEPIFKCLNHLEKLRNMRIKGIGGRNAYKETEALPVIEAKAVPILDLVTFAKVKRTGRRTMVSCCLHEDSTPSMLINSNNTVKCFSCNFSGDGIDLIRKLHGLTFTEAVLKINTIKGGLNANPRP